MFADFVNLNDARMLQAGDGLGLGPKPVQLLLPGMHAAENHLQRDDPIQIHLASHIDDTHAAATKLFQDFVAAYAVALNQGRDKIARRERCVWW